MAERGRALLRQRQLLLTLDSRQFLANEFLEGLWVRLAVVVFEHKGFLADMLASRDQNVVFLFQSGRDSGLVEDNPAFFVLETLIDIVIYYLE